MPILLLLPLHTEESAGITPFVVVAGLSRCSSPS